LLSQYGLNVYLNVEGVAFYELSIALLMLMATLYAIYTPSRLGAVASMGVLGFTVALVFIHFSAPDLGITQVLVETLTVILLILVLFKLPGFSRYSSRYEVIRDASVAVLMGVLMTLLILAAIDVQFFDSISSMSFWLIFGHWIRWAKSLCWRLLLLVFSQCSNCVLRRSHER